MNKTNSVYNIDYTKPFKFTYEDTIFTYNPPKKGDEECEITWEKRWSHDNGCSFYQLSAIKCRIEAKSWRYVEGSQKPTLPDTFKFTYKSWDIVYTASKEIDGNYLITFSIGGVEECRKHTIAHVEEALKHSWNIVDDTGETANTLGEYPTCENNVTLDTIIAQYVKTSAHKHQKEQANCTANKPLKAFTEATRASVSVIEGAYTILYKEGAYEAEDDEKLNEIIKCITFLENC